LIGFLSLELPPPPCAALLVRIGLANIQKPTSKINPVQVASTTGLSLSKPPKDLEGPEAEQELKVLLTRRE
jgi:hypothetical protein